MTGRLLVFNADNVFPFIFIFDLNKNTCFVHVIPILGSFTSYSSNSLLIILTQNDSFSFNNCSILRNQPDILQGIKCTCPWLKTG